MSRIALFFLLLFLVVTKNSNAGHLANNTLPVSIIKNTLAVSFSQDGTLWRLLPAKDFVYVDYSLDHGLSYSKAVKVNPQAQTISAWAENPPAIAVTEAGRILVLYYADEQQKSTSYFSYSDDAGKTFSSPVLVSDQAATDMHYMDKMLLDRAGNVHFFWHDRRDEAKNDALGSGVISLYHAQTNSKGKGGFNNELVTHSVCGCCRTAISLSDQGQPVLLLRMTFPDGARDHVLLSKKNAVQWESARLVSDDRWVIDACPEHGPALAIDNQGRSHLTWFSLGNKRQGIFYAQTDNYGVTVSVPMPLGNSQFLPSHPDVLATQQRVVLAWTEYNGKETSLYIQQSDNRGETWLVAKKMLSSADSVGYPKLLSHNGRVFISWVTTREGYQLIEIK